MIFGAIKGTQPFSKAFSFPNPYRKSKTNSEIA
jgi:hypothetical protein